MIDNIQQPPNKDSPTFDSWVQRLWQSLSNTVIPSGSSGGVVDPSTIDHALLSDLNSTSYTHLTAVAASELVSGGQTVLHSHPGENVTFQSTASVQLVNSSGTVTGTVLPAGVDHSLLANLNSTSYTHLTSANATDLTDGGDSTLHYHASDRNRANGTGTQPWSTIDTTPTTLSGYGITDAQPLNAKLTAVSALANASGYLHNDGSGVFAYSTPSSSGAVSNVISTPTTISADTSYIVVDYLSIQSDFTVSGNVGVF